MTEMDNVRELASLPRSEFVATLFDIEPTDYQAKLLDYGAEVARAQTAPKKGRQVGATLTAALCGASHALRPPEAPTDVLFTAPSQGTANEMFRECKKLFWNSPLSLEEFGVETENKETWELSGGVRIMSRTLGDVEQSDNSGNRGMNPTCVIVDEADYTKDAVYTEEIRPFFITHESYEFHLFSTPSNAGGYFHDKVENVGHRDVADARAEDMSWYSPYWPTEISPYAQEDEIENARQELTEDEFAQEYRGEFRSGGGLIDPDVVGKCVDPDREFNSGLRFLGVDVAGSGDDRLVIYDLDEYGVTRNIWSRREVSGPEFLDLLTDIVTGIPPDPESGPGDNTDYEAVVVERNGIGEFGADFAERELGDVIVPIASSAESKHTLYKRLVRDLEAENIALPPHSRLKRELTSLQKTTTPTGYWKVSHPDGGHDDYPDALMLANAARQNLASEFAREIKQATTVRERTSRTRMLKGQ